MEEKRVEQKAPGKKGYRDRALIDALFSFVLNYKECKNTSRKV